MDDDYLLGYLRRWKSRLKGAKRVKKHIILSSSILALSIGLFFYFSGGSPAYSATIPSGTRINPETIDPLNRIGKGEIAHYGGKGIFCDEKNLFSEETDSQRQDKIKKILASYPMAKMAPYLAERNKKVSSFLISIAKKESDWGKYSPQENGRDCYNYWGYKGGYDPTVSGYSCFDSPEQAVQVVGDRIEKLINQNIDTPERMVVWKCGYTCAGQNPADVQSWIGTVAYYFGKLNS